MHLEVVGNSCGGPREGRPGSGYLVHSATQQVLFDCGAGVATRLTAAPLSRISAIVISHMHFDHTSDLIPLGNCLVAQFGELPGLPIPVYLPPASRDVFVAYVDSYPWWVGKNLALFEHVFRPVEYVPGEQIVIGDLTVVPVGPTAHPTPTWAMRISDGSATMAYSADSAHAEVIVAAARDVDLLLCDSYGPDFGHTSHMSAEEAGRIASAAKVRRLVITHLLHHDPEFKQRLAAAAGRHFSGPVTVAEVGESYQVPLPLAQGSSVLPG